MDLLADQAAAVEAHLRRLGWIEQHEQITGMEVPGQGNMNRLLRIRLTSRSVILKQAVPYVARYPQIPAPVTRLEAEAAFYRTVAAHPGLRRHTPELLGEDPAEHLLCLEDLGTGGDLTRLYADGPGKDHGQALSVLSRWLGELHGLTIDPARVPPNRAMRELNHTHIFQVPFDADNGVALSTALGDHQRRLAGDTALRTRAHTLGQIYLGAAEHDSRPALLHGDYYPGSWLERDEETVAVIDPEFGFAGPAEFDLGVFMAHLIMSAYAPADVDAAIRHYQGPPGFSAVLAEGFAGMEVIRRLLGVAQLPLQADDDTRSGWLHWARSAVLQ
jgi:5-methylthioribose kinase